MTATHSHPARCLAALGTLLIAAGCSRNPATGQNQLNLVSEQQEIALGQQTKEQTLSTIGDYNNADAQALVKKIGMAIAKSSERPNLPWEFHVIDDDQINAFAAPGGFVFITRGIMAQMNDEAELASVIGHESGHVTARHTAQQLTQQELAQVGLGVGMIFSNQVRQMSGVLSQGLQVLFLKFSRDDESQADALGFRYMVKQHYDPHAATDMFRTLQRVSGPPDKQLPEWESTHPDPGNRVAASQHRIDSLAHTGQDTTGGARNRESYMRIIDGMVYGADPRKGYFRGNAFYHPDLRFQLTFPQGWKTANLADQVVGQSPQGNAALQLQLANGSAQDAAHQFFSQQGMQSGNVGTRAVNGLNATVGDFSAQLQDGSPVIGTAGFIELRGKTFALIGMAAAPQDQSSQQSILQGFRQTMSTFKSLDDPALLNVQAAHLKVVKVPRRMTVQEFYNQFPSTVPVQEIAVLNGTEGPTAVLQQGQSAKQVVGGMKQSATSSQ